MGLTRSATNVHHGVAAEVSDDDVSLEMSLELQVPCETKGKVERDCVRVSCFFCLVSCMSRWRCRSSSRSSVFQTTCFKARERASESERDTDDRDNLNPKP